MKIKIAEIIIEGEGAELMDLEQRIVLELENGNGKIKYKTYVKRYRNKIKIWGINKNETDGSCN